MPAKLVPLFKVGPLVGIQRPIGCFSFEDVSCLVLTHAGPHPVQNQMVQDVLILYCMTGRKIL